MKNLIISLIGLAFIAFAAPSMAAIGDDNQRGYEGADVFEDALRSFDASNPANYGPGHIKKDWSKK